MGRFKVLINEIVERKRIEKELVMCKELMTNVLDRISDSFFALDCNWRYTYVNKEAEHFHRCKIEELIGNSIWELFPNTVDSKFYVEYHKAMLEQSLRRFESSGINYPDKYFEVTVYPSEEGLTVYVRDITERKEQEEKFFKTFNASPNPIAITTLTEGRYIDINESFLSTFGYRREEVIGRTLFDLGIWVCLVDLSKTIQTLREKGQVRNLDVEFCTKTGQIRPALLSADIVDINGEQCMLSMVNDITERKALEREMYRLEKFNLIGEMAASIGHEIRNPLTTVRGFLQLLSSRIEYTTHKEYFNLMIEELDRTNSIITDYLSLAKSKPIELKRQDLNLIIRSMYPLIQADAIRTDKCPWIELGDLPYLLLDEKEIRQLILNLAHNGLEAMESGGNMTIRTFIDGGEVVLAIEDQGNGMVPEVFEKIGTPFFTTKENGTGLGLAVCYSIAARHNATIKVDTSPSGTTFSVRFKASTSS